MSWIHLDDSIVILRVAVEIATIPGALNVLSPKPVTNAQFTKFLAAALHRPALFPAPAFALRLLLGEMADALLLSSQRALPAQLQKLNHHFLHLDLAAAIAPILK